MFLMPLSFFFFGFRTPPRFPPLSKSNAEDNDAKTGGDAATSAGTAAGGGGGAAGAAGAAAACGAAGSGFGVRASGCGGVRVIAAGVTAAISSIELDNSKYGTTERTKQPTALWSEEGDDDDAMQLCARDNRSKLCRPSK